MSEWGAHSLEDVGLAMCIVVPGSLVYSWLIITVGTKLGMTDDVGGSPRYMNYACIVGVMFYLVPVGVAGWLTSGLALEPYLRRQWLPGAEKFEDQYLEVWFIYGIIFSMFKDFPAGLRPLIMLHHAVVIGTAFGFLSIGPPGMYTLGGAIMEIGSAMNCCFLMHQNSMPVAHVNLTVMTLTNIFGAYCAWILFTAVGTPEVIQWLFPPMALTMIFFRQKEIMFEWGETRKRQGQSEPVEAGAELMS